MSLQHDLGVIARYGGSNARTGACSPAAASVAVSWGGACPSGYCPPNNLPAALGRFFAGQREGCREMPYGFAFVGAASATAVVLQGTSVAAFCPTRITAVETGSAGVGLANWYIDIIKFGNENQIVGTSIPATMLAPNAKQSVPLVPACLDSGQTYLLRATPTVVTAPGDTTLHLQFWGPAVA